MYKEVCVATLHNGVYMPVLGLGTWQLPDNDQTTQQVQHALQEGYFLIDTADCYDNQTAIGKALKQWDPSTRKQQKSIKYPPRPDKFKVVSVEQFEANFETPHGSSTEPKVFITGKIFTRDFVDDEKMMASYERFVQQVGRTPDLILLHWPGPHSEWSSEKDQKDPTNGESRVRCWKFLEKLYKDKKVRAIGVSNYMWTHLASLIEDVRTRGGIVPHVNQIEISPQVHLDAKLRELCTKENIHLTAYSPLGSSGQKVLNNSHMHTILDETAIKDSIKSTNKLALRWALQSGYCVIPRTSKLDHLKDNLETLNVELSDELMKKIDQCPPGPRACPDPHEIV